MVPAFSGFGLPFAFASLLLWFSVCCDRTAETMLKVAVGSAITYFPAVYNCLTMCQVHISFQGDFRLMFLRDRCIAFPWTTLNFSHSKCRGGKCFASFWLHHGHTVLVFDVFLHVKICISHPFLAHEVDLANILS